VEEARHLFVCVSVFTRGDKKVWRVEKIRREKAKRTTLESRDDIYNLKYFYDATTITTDAASFSLSLRACLPLSHHHAPPPPRINGTTLPNKAYHPPATSKNPLAGVTHAVFSLTPMTLLMFPAALAASNSGIEYPNV